MRDCIGTHDSIFPKPEDIHYLQLLIFLCFYYLSRGYGLKGEGKVKYR